MATEAAGGLWRNFLVAATRIAREPLAQFFAVALVLFGAERIIHGPERQHPGFEISISQGRVRQIAESYRLLTGRLPSRAELQALVEDFIDEEVDYREAIAMGLDADDTIVRRRMRQKLEFLAEDGEVVAEPSEAQLAQWLRDHPASYRLEERISFRQVLAGRDSRGARAEADARAFVARLRAGADPESMGDASMLPSVAPATTQQGVGAQFGEAFAAGLFNHRGEGWFGPLTSPFGAHAVLIVSRDAGRAPPLAQVRERVRADWIQAERQAKRDAFQTRLRERYRVTIQWPEPYASQPAPRDVPHIRRLPNGEE